MILKLTEQNGFTIAEFINTSRFTLPVCDKVIAELRPVINRSGSKVILDLRGIDFIDSSGIGTIIALFKTAKSKESTLKLCNLSPEVIDIFKLLNLQVIFDISGTGEGCIKEE